MSDDIDVGPGVHEIDHNMEVSDDDVPEPEDAVNDIVGLPNKRESEVHQENQGC